MRSEILATLCLGAAILHTFAAGTLRTRVPRSLKFLAEVELAFAVWALVYLIALSATQGVAWTGDFLLGLRFHEPFFVFVILLLCATPPILSATRALILWVARRLPLPERTALYASTLLIGPLLGSLITEPAAMTVTALLLRERFLREGASPRLLYSTLGVLFVNVSVGGTLTPYAAPPILMVAAPWGWDLPFMLTHFGAKGVIACLISTAIVTLSNRRELDAAQTTADRARGAPWSLVLLYSLLLAATVGFAHQPVGLLACLAALLVLFRVTRAHMNPLQWHESAGVALFLAGLVVLGAPQSWWLEPLIAPLDTLPLYLGAIGLTAMTDNAALTYLGAQVPTLAESARYFLVAGAVVGGGLTVIANAPNPVGYAILRGSFGATGISAVRLLLAALPPTLVAALIFWLF